MLRRPWILSILGLFLLLPGCRQAEARTPPASSGGSGYRVLKPVTHANLAVYLIEGAQPLEGHRFMTLEEALDQKKAVVHETSDVNELTVENLTIDLDIYIQAGDIIKGGKQDRVFESDFIVPPKSGKVPIAAFCVEQGRWSRRGSESSAQFSSSKTALSSRELKLAAKASREQGQVWARVADAQDKLAAAVAAPVQSAESRSSLQLTLENEHVGRATEAYVRALADLLRQNPNATGYAFAINGRINSADVYGSHELLVKLWPKLLQSMAVEAVSERATGRGAPAPAVSSVERFLAPPADPNIESKNASARVRLVKAESDGKIVFGTQDRKNTGAWVHRNFIAK
jgi:hypothetical protein